MHFIMTMELDQKLRKWVTELHDGALLSKLAAEDMVALEEKYHKRCTNNYSNRHWIFLH